MMVKAIAKRWVPRPVIDWVKKSGTLTQIYHRIAPPIKRLLLRNSTHDQIYGDDYFSMVDQTTGNSAEIMASSILEHLSPASVIDIGCGTGSLIDRLRNLGVTVKGVDYAKSAFRYCRERELDVSNIDLSDPEQSSKTLGTFDLAISTEVGHQLPPSISENFIDFICRHAEKVLFSSPPGGGGQIAAQSASAGILDRQI